MARAEKVAAVAELTERFQSSSGAVLTEYRGLTVAQLAELRHSLGEQATFSVVKNTLTKLAAAEAGIAAELDGLLSGPSAIAFVKGDVVEAAKGLRDFAKANPALVIKGGVIDGKSMSPAEIERLADLESREVLLAMLAGAMKASMAERGGHAQRAAGPDGPAGRGAPGEAGSRGRRHGAGRRGAGRRGARPTRHRSRAPAAELTRPEPGTDQARSRHTERRARGRRRRGRRPINGGMTTMAKLSTDDLLDAFKEMTLLELSDFVKKFEDDLRRQGRGPGRGGRRGTAAAAAPPPRPRSRRRTSSTSSSRPRATRRSRSSRKSAP